MNLFSTDIKEPLAIAYSNKRSSLISDTTLEDIFPASFQKYLWENRRQDGHLRRCIDVFVSFVTFSSFFHTHNT